MFRAMPSDGAQAAALLAHAARRGLRRIAVFVEGERDSVIAGNRIREAAVRSGISLALVVQIGPQEPEADAGRLAGTEADGVLLWGRAETGLRFLRALRAAGCRLPVLAPASLAAPGTLDGAAALGDLTVAAPCDLAGASPDRDEFSRRFRERTGREAGPIALCAHDAARLVLDAVDRAGLSRARIRDELSAARFSGLAGEIRFNDLGGNVRAPVLLEVVDGRWARAEAGESPK